MWENVCGCVFMSQSAWLCLLFHLAVVCQHKLQVWSLTRQSSNTDVTHWVEFILSLNSTFIVQLFKHTHDKKHELAIKKDGTR